MKNIIDLTNQEHVLLLMWSFIYSLLIKYKNPKYKKLKNIKEDDILLLKNRIDRKIQKLNLESEEIYEKGKNYPNLKIDHDKIK